MYPRLGSDRSVLPIVATTGRAFYLVLSSAKVPNYVQYVQSLLACQANRAEMQTRQNAAFKRNDQLHRDATPHDPEPMLTY